MNLNVQLQGLKYNYEKGQGCFCKNSEIPVIFGIYEIIFHKKIP
jgi:hypothetical protein